MQSPSAVSSTSEHRSHEHRKGPPKASSSPSGASALGYLVTKPPGHCSWDCSPLKIADLSQRGSRPVTSTSKCGREDRRIQVQRSKFASVRVRHCSKPRSLCRTRFRLSVSAIVAASDPDARVLRQLFSRSSAILRVCDTAPVFPGTGSAWRWAIFHSPPSRRKIVVTRSLYGSGGAPATETVECSIATI